MDIKSELEPIYTAHEVKDFLRVCLTTAIGLIDSGKIRSLPNLGNGKRKIRRVPHSAIVEFMNRQASSPAATGGTSSEVSSIQVPVRRHLKLRT